MPNGEQELDPEGEARAVSGILTERRTRRATTRVMKKRSTHLPVGKGDPSSPTIPQAPATRQPFRLGSRQSVLGHPLRRRLKRLRNNPRSYHRRPERRCPESKSTSLLPLRKCPVFGFTRNSVLSIFPWFDRMNLETSSAATSGTSAYKNDDENMEDAVTSRPGIISAILSLLCRLNCDITNQR